MINLPEWQQQQLSAKSIDILNSGTFAFYDQDVMNLLVGDKFIGLHPKWNFQHGNKPDDVRIIHFTHAKPNTTYCVHPDKALFLEYRSQTPWASARLKTSWDKRFNRVFHSVMRKVKNWRN